MSMRLNVGLSKKVGEANYGSRGASVNLDLELDSALVAEPARLQDRIRQLFALVRTSLQEELNGNGNGNGNGHAANHDPNPIPHSSPSKSNGNGGSHQSSERPATPAQIKALYAITRQQALNLDELLQDRYRVHRPDELTLRQASRLIDSLKSSDHQPGA